MLDRHQDPGTVYIGRNKFTFTFTITSIQVKKKERPKVENKYDWQTKKKHSNKQVYGFAT